MRSENNFDSNLLDLACTMYEGLTKSEIFKQFQQLNDHYVKLPEWNELLGEKKIAFTKELIRVVGISAMLTCGEVQDDKAI